MVQSANQVQLREAATVVRTANHGAGALRAFVGFLAFVFASFALTPYLGRDFFPSVDAGQILMHARTRVDELPTSLQKSRRPSGRSSRQPPG